MATTSKRKAADDSAKEGTKKAKTGKVEKEVKEAPVEDEDEVHIDPSELEALDSSNIIEGGRRTRGRRIDYTKVEDAGQDEEDDEDDDEEAEPQGDEDDEEEEEEEEKEEKAPVSKSGKTAPKATVEDEEDEDEDE